jgi:hypothetical protein
MKLECAFLMVENSNRKQEPDNAVGVKSVLRMNMPTHAAKVMLGWYVAMRGSACLACDRRRLNLLPSGFATWRD